MHILIFASYAPSLVNFRGPLIQSIRKLGHQVTVGAPDVDPALRGKLESWGVNVYQTPLHRNNVSIRSDMKYHQTLYRLLRRVQPDRVLTYTIKPNIWGAFAAKRAGVPSFALVTGLGFAFVGTESQNSPKTRAISAIARFLYRQAARYNEMLIFQNPDDLEDFVLAGCVSHRSKTALVNGSGVNMSHYSRGAAVEAPVFLMISRLLKSKGVSEYIDASRDLRTRYPEARFRLVGPTDGGPDAISPETVGRLQSEGWVEYLGPLDDVRPEIARSAVYVLPSYREGTPRSVLEAMAMGRPIVTTDAPGCRETVVDGENGFLVPVADSQALAKAMQRFIDDPSLIAPMGQKSFELAREKYDVHKVNKAMLEILGLDLACDPKTQLRRSPTAAEDHTNT